MRPSTLRQAGKARASARATGRPSCPTTAIHYVIMVGPHELGPSSPLNFMLRGTRSSTSSTSERRSSSSGRLIQPRRVTDELKSVGLG
jgi:hypothetical protein